MNKFLICIRNYSFADKSQYIFTTVQLNCILIHSIFTIKFFSKDLYRERKSVTRREGNEKREKGSSISFNAPDFESYI